MALFRRDNIIIRLLTEGKGPWSLQASEEQRMRNLGVWWNKWQHQSLKLKQWNVHSSAYENRSGRQGAVSCQMSNILMSQEKSPMFDLVSGAYGGWKAWPSSPPIPTSPRPPGCQFLELCHYKDSRTAAHMWATQLNWVQVHTSKHRAVPAQRTRRLHRLMMIFVYFNTVF